MSNNSMPLQTALQQRDARPISGEHLETLGKKAAADWCSGKCASLSESVVNVVREERLAPEQVRRVVEFCNQDAYLREFRKEGQVNRVVHFDCGPADPAQVLQDLNDGGGGTVYDDGNLDYQMPPVAGGTKTASADLTKTASAGELPPDPYEAGFWALFGPQGEEPVADNREIFRVREKLADARSHVASELDLLESNYREAGEALYCQVKSAALNGMPLGHMVSAWGFVQEDPAFVKAAFDLLSPRLRADGVFGSYEEMGASLEKAASARAIVNPEHPLMVRYAEFCESLQKLAELRAIHGELDLGYRQAHEIVKQAALGGAAGTVVRGAQRASRAIDKAAPAVAKALAGADNVGTLAPVLATGTKAVGAGGALLAGNAAVQSVTDRPAVRKALGIAKSTVPGTQEYQLRRYRTMTGQRA